MPGPWLFFHHLTSSCSLMDIRVWWSSLYTAFTLTRGHRAGLLWHNKYTLALHQPKSHTHYSHTQSSDGCSPLIISDVKMSVDGEEGLLQKADPLPLLLLRLFKNGFHLLHVARRVGRHILQHFLVALSTLQAAHRKSFMMKLPHISSGRTSIVFL